MINSKFFVVSKKKKKIKNKKSQKIKERGKGITSWKIDLSYFISFFGVSSDLPEEKTK